MNAGARKQRPTNISQAAKHGSIIQASAEVLDDQGQAHTLTPSDMGMAYRHNDLPPDWIVLGATFNGYAANPETLKAEIDGCHCLSQ